MQRLLFFFFFLISTLSAAPQAIYLTLTEDPAHSISVQWIEKKQKGTFKSLFYQKKGEVSWIQLGLTSDEYLGSSYFIKRCLIENLEASTNYLFRLEGESTLYKFCTLPLELKEPLKVVAGGDLMESFSLFRRMNQIAAEKNPDFVVLGGDIAYAAGVGVFRGKHGSISKWVSFFKGWQKSMVGKDGRMIPVTAALGNHDITPTDRRENGENALFFKFFPSFQNSSYKTLNVGKTLSFFLLDSGHLSQIDSKQVEWLETTFKEKENVKWKIPIYHISAYPSVYSPNRKVPKLIRKCWVPLFEKNGVKLAFEHHNHAFKKTFPLLKDQINIEGIIYLGDGGYGAPPRKVTSYSYLEKSSSISSFCLMTIDANSLTAETFNIKNEVIDTVYLK